MFNKFLKNKKGFTLVETLVAISVFSVSVLGLFAVLTQGTSNTAYAKKKIVASYLAQEGIEYMRNLRDTYILYPNSAAGRSMRWSRFITKLTLPGRCFSTGCYVDDSAVLYDDDSAPMMDLQLPPCGSNCPKLKYNDTTKKYDYDASGVDSGFTRRITAESINPNEIKIVSTVSWVQGTTTHSVAFSENLFNWTE